MATGAAVSDAGRWRITTSDWAGPAEPPHPGRLVGDSDAEYVLGWVLLGLSFVMFMIVAIFGPA
jgi:hypothetical protein